MSDIVWPSSTKPLPVISTPIRTSRLEPKRSISTPTTGASTPPWILESDSAAPSAAAFQPRSSRIELKKTPIP